VPPNAATEAGLPLLPGLLHPDRWLLWLGLLFIASVYFFRPASWDFKKPAARITLK
jgi:hypothetical protein